MCKWSNIGLIGKEIVPRDCQCACFVFAIRISEQGHTGAEREAAVCLTGPTTRGVVFKGTLPIQGF